MRGGELAHQEAEFDDATGGVPQSDRVPSPREGAGIAVPQFTGLGSGVQQLVLHGGEPGTAEVSHVLVAQPGDGEPPQRVNIHTGSAATPDRAPATDCCQAPVP